MTNEQAAEIIKLLREIAAKQPQVITIYPQPQYVPAPWVIPSVQPWPWQQPRITWCYSTGETT